MKDRDFIVLVKGGLWHVPSDTTEDEYILFLLILNYEPT
jgi:hypothetical protein